MQLGNSDGKKVFLIVTILKLANGPKHGKVNEQRSAPPVS